MTAPISTTRTSASLRALTRRELVTGPADGKSLRTELRLTRERLINSLSKTDDSRGRLHRSYGGQVLDSIIVR